MKFTLRPQRRRASQTGPGISLFPFLAVLICTMGALVPLLLAMTRTARLQAEAAAIARAAQQAAKYGAAVRMQREDARGRIGQLKRTREQTAAQLADARLELGHLEDHTRRLRTQLGQYENTVKEFDRLENVDHPRLAQTQAELERLRRQIGVTQQQVAEARKAAAGHNRCYAVVPYEGPNQTHRRPIYIECRADAVVLQPEGIVLTDADFDGPMGPGNPLAAALRAAREHLLAAHDFDPNAGEPYPLLLVRPEGINAFYAARAAMKSWGGDFGYELIGDDWKLAYQPPDPRFADVVRQAIGSARIRQEQLIASAPRQYEHRPKSAYQASNDGGSGDGWGPGSGVRGQGSGIRGQVAGNGNGSGADGPYPYGTASQRPGTAVPGGESTGSISSAAPFGGNSATGGAVTGMAGGNAAQTAGYGGQGTGYGAGNSNSSGYGAGNGNGSGYGAGNGNGGGNGEYNPYVALPERPGTAVPGGELASSISPAAPYAGNYTGGVAPGTPGGGNSTNGAVGGGAASAAGNGAAGASGSGGDSAGGSPSGGTSGQGNPMRSNTDGYIVGQPPREQETSNQPLPPDAMRGPALRPGEWEPSPDIPPEKKPDEKDDDDLGKHHKPKPLASQRGEDWGLRNAARNAVGITRPMRIECYADRLVVVSDGGPAGTKVIPLGPRTESSIDPLISAVWEQISAWGMAGHGMYWRPVLHVSVAPGAERRFADLSTLLKGSGLTVERK